MSSVVDAFAKEKPGDDAAKHPEHKGDISGWLSFKPDLKNKPEDCNVDRRMNKCPEDAEIRTEILAAEILLCQLQDHITTQKKVFKKL